ncbi:MAG TPA: hypothetical protein VG477_06825, partial [Thermoanaerobaculia bacterium]|nr:hypothetical protein [Thermoanaerobaculia bacterium]
MKPLLLTALLIACAPGQADRPAPESAAMTSESPTPGEVLATRDKPVTLEMDRTTVEIEMPPAAKESLGTEEGRLGLYLEGLDLGRTGTYFDVYANLPPGAEPAPEGPHHVGALSSYGPAGAKV